MLPKAPPKTRIKPKRLQNAKHLDAIRALPCVICWEDRSDMSRAAHHLLRGVVRGTSLKAGDDCVIPVCSEHHHQLHMHGNETAYLASKGITDAPALAKALYEATGYYDAMLSVLGDAL